MIAFHRRSPRGARGRADLQGAADRPVDLLRPCGQAARSGQADARGADEAVPCPGAPHRIEPPVRAELFDDPEHARRDRILRSIPGVGPVTAAILCAEMPELGTLGRRLSESRSTRR